jgi:GGDEF domain-containing protein
MEGPPSHRRPRPVADAPVARLADGTEVAKAWLLALVAEQPLERAATVPAAELARGGPAFCAALLEVLGSDEALERFAGPTGPGERLPVAALAGRLAGARTPPALTAAVEALRGVAWRALLAELRDPPAALVADLSDRLAHVCAVVACSSLEHLSAEPAGRSGPLADVLATGAPEQAREEPAREPEDRPGDEPPGAEASQAAPAESAGEEPRGAPPDGAHVVGPPPDADDAVPRRRFALPRDFDRDVAPPAPPVAPPANGGAVTVTRVTPPASGGKAVDDEPPWRAAIARRLERRAVDGRPFAVLAVEVDDLDRLLASETGREVAFALEVAERGLTAALAPADLVVRERLGRWWLTSPDRDAGAARDLALRVGEAVAAAVLGGVPLRASIGVAVCPDDGEDLDALSTRADVGVFSARSGGLPLG